MPRKLRELRAELAQAGWYHHHTTGSHEIWVHDLLPGDRLVLAGHDGDDARREHERMVHAAITRAHSAHRRQQQP